MAHVSSNIAPAASEATVTDDPVGPSQISQYNRDPKSCQPLLNLLFESMNKHPDGKNFLTLHCLRKLLFRSRVQNYLQEFFDNANGPDYPSPTENMEYYLGLICADGQPGANSITTDGKTYIRLFASLVLAEQATYIFKLIDDGICDQNLPIIKGPNDNCSLYTSKWNIRDKIEFNSYQWRMNVPFLERGKHKEFSNEVVMPFLDNTSSRPNSDAPDLPETRGGYGEVSSVETRGGYGEVSFVEIHSKAHNFCDEPCPPVFKKRLFALKKLYGTANCERNKKDFQKEVEMLKRFSGNIHPHIVTVLMTYKHENRYCFLFPRAECDLDQYFQLNTNPKGDVKTVRWLAGQCLKLTEAVDTVHNPPGQGSLQPNERLYGRHGDIKAENILVFSAEGKEDVLVLSDFGLGSMHHDWSKSNIPNKNITWTPPFRPPECDMENGYISRAFDIWTLGCLFLDLLTWLLGGEELRKQFLEKRMTPYITGCNMPIYFEIITTENGRTGIIIKEEVKDWFVTMHHHPHCTHFMHEFLDLIEKKMLIVETEVDKRARTGELLKDLRLFHAKCTGPGNNEYCFNQQPDKDRLSIRPIIAEGSLSEDARDRIRKSKICLRRFSGPTQRAEQNLEEGDELLRNIQIPRNMQGSVQSNANQHVWHTY
ncbi:kinase-like domain-containing protein [Daldinia decipiens]|uniref:kinase-like domain-containing protein n=1 Tax=Daldinia decipiens TaxID=326647 RepID=UPI0020C3315D|nr:kinase-like domain-containing protein [Daldinia decipiens]KAI1655238.1 kinase-like domain-containing protein [Daldinia decipiens]